MRGFRRLPVDVAAMWHRLLRGSSREALENLAVRLLEHAGARARPAETQALLKAIGRFFEDEARELAQARAAAGHAAYPVSQEDRDLIFARYRRASG